MAISSVNVNTILTKLQSSSSLLSALNSTEDTTSDLLTNAANAQTTIASISELGAKINASYQAAQASGDSDTVENFASTMMSVLNNPDPLETIDFINNISEMAESGSSTFNDVLSTYSALSSGEASNGTVTYNNLVNSLYQNYGTEAVDELNASVETINNADYAESQVSLNDSLANVYNIYNQILNSDMEAEDATALMSALNTGLQKQETGDSIGDYLTMFKSDNGLA